MFISSSVYVTKASLQVGPCLSSKSGTQGTRASILASAFVTAEAGKGNVTNHTLGLNFEGFCMEVAFVNSDLI